MMERPSTSGERTPLVQPTYVFESSLSRRYQKRLRNFQCTICVFLITVLMIALLVTVSYNLTDDDAPPPTSTVPAVTSSQLSRSTTLTDSAPTAPSLQAVMLRASPGVTPAAMAVVPRVLKPVMGLDWPIKAPTTFSQGRPPSPWIGNSTSPEAVSSAVAHGTAALHSRKQLERDRRPLDVDSPAGRAQRATATSGDLKPMADAAYAVEQATRALTNGTSSRRFGGVGQGPRVNGSFPTPAYCQPWAPPCADSRYRTIDGTCNNLQHPTRWGVSNTPFRRVLPPDYGDGISSPRTGLHGGALPSARDVSVTVHRPGYAHDTSFTVMLAVWGQFIDHDITATALSKGENNSALSCCSSSLPPHPECFPVRLAAQDRFYQEYNLTCMEFVRSAPAPTCHFGPREQMNQATAFIDASTVYGFDAGRAARLRSFQGGRLRVLTVGGRELLPPSTDPGDGCNTQQMISKGRYCFESGDDRANENLHLTTMHLIWARQHNRVAGALRVLNPAWTDETLYQEARRIVGAQMQHITYNEFLPNIIGMDVMWALNLTVKSEGFADVYRPDVDPSIANHFAAAAFRFAHTLLPGLIHAVDANTGSPNYVHLHEMLFNPYQLYLAQGAELAVSSALRTAVQAGHMHVTDELSNHLFERPVIFNTSNSTPAPTTAQAAPRPPPAPCGLDLVSLNIQRGRDHGLPPYVSWRQLCGFPRPKTWDDLRGVFDESSFGRISTIYSHVEDIDLYTGALAEDPQGRLLGATLTCLIADQFLRLKIGDRFWYERSGDIGFTIDQLTELRKTTLAGVICANEVLLSQAQPRAMLTEKPDNPLVACDELPQPDFSVFKDNTLTASAPTMT